jgi:hypothetical protein
METPNHAPAGSIGTVKILVAALLMGLITATGVMFMLVQQGIHQPQRGMESLLLVLAVLWPVTAGASLLIKGAMMKQARTRWEAEGGGDDSALFPHFMSMTIVRAALLEGPGLFGAVTYLLTGNALALIAPALSIAGLGLMFPTEEKFRDFVRSVTGKL